MVVVNLLAVFVSAIAAFILGWVWYSPKLFGHFCQLNNSLVKEQVGHGAPTYIVAFILQFIAALGFAVFINISGSTDVISAVRLGFSVSVIFIATSFAVNYMFSGRSIKVLAVDVGYYIVQFVLFGVILGLWR